MYTPPHFAEDGLPTLWDAIERYSFAILASQDNGQLVASHLPLLLDRGSGSKGTLLGHLARANPQWQSAATQEVLVVFSGPHAYISPTWYAAERVVPTWNYVAIHAYGKLELMDDRDTSSLLARMVAHFEAPLPQPWQLAGQPADFTANLTRQIVGFRIPIDRLEGKWKLNQNQPAERRERVASALENHGSADALAVAELMRERESAR
ncbi:MAG: FMN-binding negative transcriptional regulator [Pirellulaceae bacterium]|nr:FMN-binding negative transcriptional regulator [Pirellulaceae bacterium]